MTQEVDNTLELFAAGVEFAAEWHREQAQKWAERGWSETAKEHNHSAEELSKMAETLKKAGTP